MPLDWCNAVLSLNFGFLPADTPRTLISPKMLGTETGGNELRFNNCTRDKEILIKKINKH